MGTIMTQRKAKNKDISYYCNVIIFLLFMFGFGYLPPFAQLTEMGMHALGIFIGLLWAWSTVDLLWPSLLGFIAIGMTGYMPIQQAIATGFSDSTVLMVLFMFVFTEYMNQTGVCRSIACWFISRKIVIGRPWVFVFMLLMSAYIIGGSTSPLASTIIGWSIFYEICEVAGFKKYDKFPVLIIIGIVYSGILGGTILPFRPIAGVVLNGVDGVTGLNCDPLVFAFSSMVLSFICVVVFILLCKYIFRPDVGILRSPEDIFAKYRSNRMLPKEKIAGVSLILVLLANFLPSVLPKHWALVVFLSKFTMTAVFALMLLILAAIRIKGKPLADISGAFSRGVQWPIIVMLASSMPLAAMMKAEESGVNDLFAHLIMYLLQDASPYMIAVIFLVFVGILTQFAHNLVLAIVLSPIIANIGLTMGFNPYPIAILLAFMANLGFATPGASAFGAMLIGNKEWVPTAQGYGYSFILVGVSLVIICLIGVPFVNLFF